MNRDVFYGKIDKSGNVMLDLARVRSFASQYSGMRVAVTIQPIAEEPSVRFVNWYRYYVLPKVRFALEEIGVHYDEKDTDIFLRKQCPIMKWSRDELRHVNDLDSSELQLYIDQINELTNELGLSFDLYN